jgi:hypothetical protein
MREPRLPFDDRFPDGPPLYGCSGCRRDLASLKAFDLHFDRFEGRLTCGALDSGWLQDARGRWTTVALAAGAERLREHHRRAA